jgi:hypothetical protein
MRDVRRRERLAGLKRTSRQKCGNVSKAINADEQRVVLRGASKSSASSLVTDPDAESLIPAICRGRPDRWCAGYPLPLHSTPNPPKSWFLDPFFTLPGAAELSEVVAPLLYYCEWYARRSRPGASKVCSMSFPGLGLTTG